MYKFVIPVRYEAGAIEAQGASRTSAALRLKRRSTFGSEDASCNFGRIPPKAPKEAHKPARCGLVHRAVALSERVQLIRAIYSTGIERRLDTSDFGNTNSRIPSLKVALALLSSTSAGSARVRENEPRDSSRR